MSNILFAFIGSFFLYLSQKIDMKKPKVLYVDDEPINLQLFEINFSQKYNISTTENGIEGLQLLKNNIDTDIVIGDMKMPKLNGIEFIKKAKELNPKIKCFILTGYGMTEEIKNAIQDGTIINCLNKPFEMEIIENELQAALSNY